MNVQTPVQDRAAAARMIHYRKRNRPVRALKAVSSSEQMRAFCDVIEGRSSELLAEWGRSQSGLVVDALYHAGAPVTVFRNELRTAWQGERDVLFEHFRPRKNPHIIVDMFRYARFPRPELPDQVTVFRGASPKPDGRPLLIRAIAPDAFNPWVLERDAACAMALASREYEPIVIRRTVPRDAILWCQAWADDDFPFTELVFDASPAGEIDGNIPEWRDRQDYMTSIRLGTPVVGPVGTGPDPIENLKAAMDTRGRGALDTLLTQAPPEGKLEQYNGEVYAREIPIPLKGAAVVALYRAGAPPGNVRGFLHHTWVRGYKRVTAAVSSPEELFAMFRYAKYPIPEGSPDTVTVYRGTAGVDIETARRGMSWTLNRDSACWYAVDGARERGFTGTPLVLRRDVKVGEALFYAHDGYRSELVFDPASGEAAPHPETAGVVDGHLADWREASARYVRTSAANPSFG